MAMRRRRIPSGLSVPVRRLVHTQGTVEPLYVTGYGSNCGDIRDFEGVAFRFGRSGDWVVPLDELRAIVSEAERVRESDPTRGLAIELNWRATESKRSNPAAHDCYQLALQHLEQVRLLVEKAKEASK